MAVDRATCPACLGPLRAWRAAVSAETGADVPLLRCGACGTAVTDAPVPGDAHATGAYTAGPPRLARAAAPLLARFDRRRLALLPPPPARVADAGAGRGRFVAAARAAGYDAVGVEPALRPAVVDLVRAPLEDVALHADAATLWHVLEHVGDPEAALRAVRRWLPPGGTLVVGVPNLGSLQARLGGARWFHLDVPRHRTHFTVAGLAALLERTGFAVERVDHVLLEHNPYGMWQSLVSRATRRPSYAYNLLKRNAPLDPRDLALTIAALPLAPLAALVELAAGLARRGGTVAVTARAR